MVISTQLPRLKNFYHVMRHGQSLANVAGIIVSHPENGVNNYGLSDKGRRQVEDGANASALPSSTRILSSDFMRAQETAEIVHQHLGCSQPVTFEKRLRERHFGELELGPDTRYPEIWAFDQHDPEHCEHSVESVSSVAQRAIAVVLECEEKYRSEICLLVAHGDILQILQTAFSNIPATAHRQLPQLDTAEVRELKQA